MRVRLRSVPLLIALLLVSVAIGTPSMSAQGADATPAAGTAEQASPRFALLPVGDFPDGFFRDVEVAPGVSVELTVAVVNTGSLPVSLRTFRVNALSNVNGGYLSGEEGDAPIGASAWIDYPAVSLDLEPNAQREITFQVNVPAGTSPGQYMAGLVVETADTIPIPGTEALDHTLGYAISVGILVPGEMVHAFDLGDPAFVEEAGMRRLRIPVSNTGNHLVRPAGDLKLFNVVGEEVFTSAITMGSVYGGLSTSIEVLLPEQMPAGAYTVELALTDEASGVQDEIANAVATLPEPADPSALTIASVDLEPNAEPIVFANVGVTLDNGGQLIPATDVTLHVLHDGTEVEQFPLATNQALPTGTTEVTARYLPAETWEAGTYSFAITVSAVDPQGETETVLVTYDVEQTIEVP